MKTRSNKRCSAKTRRMSQKGGAAPDSAWGFQMNNLGNGWTQFMNSLSLQPGQSASNQSNVIVPIRNAGKMVGGKKHRRAGRARSQGRSKKGGYWGAVIEQAAVPLTLLGMQQVYGRRKNKSAKRGR
jgi:hypothetical protein